MCKKRYLLPPACKWFKSEYCKCVYNFGNKWTIRKGLLKNVFDNKENSQSRCQIRYVDWDLGGSSNFRPFYSVSLEIIGVNYWTRIKAKQYGFDLVRHPHSSLHWDSNSGPSTPNGFERRNHQRSRPLGPMPLAYRGKMCFIIARFACKGDNKAWLKVNLFPDLSINDPYYDVPFLII